jgi:hypothetical protein
MSFLRRLSGVFFKPRSTFEGLAARPAWIDALVVVLVALTVFNVIISPYFLKDQREREENSPALKERLGEDTFNKRIESLENPTKLQIFRQNVVITLIYLLFVVLLQSLLLLMFGRFLSTQGSYMQVLSVLVHANLIDKLAGNAVRLPLILARRSVTQVSTSVAALFPTMDSLSIPYIVLKQLDLFQLWMFGVLAFGLAAIFKIRMKMALALSCGLWFLKALVNIGMAFLR